LRIALGAIPLRDIAGGVLVFPLFLLQVILLVPVLSTVLVSWLIAEGLLPLTCAGINLIGGSVLARAGGPADERSSRDVRRIGFAALHALVPGVSIGILLAFPVVW